MGSKVGGPTTKEASMLYVEHKLPVILLRYDEEKAVYICIAAHPAELIRVPEDRIHATSGKSEKASMCRVAKMQSEEQPAPGDEGEDVPVGPPSGPPDETQSEEEPTPEERPAPKTTHKRGRYK